MENGDIIQPQNFNLSEEEMNLKSIYSPQINLDFPARISSELFNYGQYRWKMNVRPFRLLMMVTQTLAMEKQQSSLLFPEYVFPINKVFEYMGIANNNKRYDLLATDIKELMSTVIEKKEKSKKGKFKWIGKTLISMCRIDSEDSSLRIKINEESRDYLVGMKRWAELEPRIYLKLNTSYQNWFYAYFKKELFIVLGTSKTLKMTVKIDILKEILFLDDVKTYDPEHNKNANEKFFNKVIGIKKPKTWKYNSAAELDNEPWDYYTEDNKPTGTLYNITASTDINVTAFPIKEGKAYAKICFIVGHKKAFLTKEKTFKTEQSSKKSTASNVSKTTRRKRSASSPEMMKDLFNETYFLDTYNVSKEEIPQSTHISIPRETIAALTENHNLQNPNNQKTIEDFGRELGYEIDDSGNFVKDMNKPLNIPK